MCFGEPRVCVTVEPVYPHTLIPMNFGWIKEACGLVNHGIIKQFTMCRYVFSADY